ncbi:MAG: helix-turn-helix domain-containing protein [Deltaproteobacteria bacterium]|nr:helix-turn-helix domain-containing protein [Deltaproteobacteria bacterium]
MAAPVAPGAQPDPVPPPGAAVAAEPAAPAEDPSAPILTIPEAAALLRIHVKTAYQWALEHRLPGAFRLGGRWRVSRRRLLGYVRESSVSSLEEIER